MDRVGIRELRQNLSRYVERVKAGETLEVTEYGAPVAVLAPRAVGEDTIGRLENEGRIARRGHGRIADLPPPLKLPAGARPTIEILDEIREDSI